MNLDTLLAIAGLGTAATGAVLGSRAQGKANQISQDNSDKMYGLAQQEQARRDQLLNMLMPSINRGLRSNATPQQIGQNTGMQYGQQQPNRGLAQPGQSKSGAFGDVMNGMQFGGMVGGPYGAIAGATIGGVSNLFGKGRRAADPWTKTTQNDFGQQVAGIIDPFNAAKSAGTLTPEQQTQAQNDFNRLLAEYSASANQYGGTGKNQKKVIDQMWQQYNGAGYIPDWKKTLGIA